MKEKAGLFSNARYAVLSLLIIYCSCKKNVKGADTLPISCKIVQSRDSAWGIGGTGIPYQEISVSDFQYDAAGEMSEVDATDNKKNSDHTSSGSTSVTTYQHDRDGFITNLLSKTSAIDGQNNMTESDGAYHLFYSNQKLVKIFLTSVYKGSSSSDTISYSYDSVGRQEEVVMLGSDGQTDTRYSYSSNGLFKIVRTNLKNGITDEPFIEVNGMGLFTRIIFGGTDERLQYDAQGDLTRDETWINGKPDVATAYEYDTERNYDALVSPAPKGFPQYSFTTLPYYLAPHNSTHITRYHSDAAANWVQVTDESYAYMYNEKGFPVSIEMRGFSAGSTSPSSGRSTKIEYADCN